MYNFLVVTEHHARRIAPIIKRLPKEKVILYRGSQGRNHLIDVEFPLWGVDSSDYRIKPFESWFGDVITIPGVYISQLMVGYKACHPFYNHCGDLQKFLKTPRKDLAGRLALINENYYAHHPDQIPKTHLLMAKSAIEAQSLKELLPAVDVRFIGDTHLDDYNSRLHRLKRRRIKNLLILTCSDPMRSHLTAKLITDIVCDLNEWKKNGRNFSNIAIKGHSADNNSKYQNDLIMACKTNGWPVEIVDRNIHMGSLLKNADAIISQGSFSSLAYGWSAGLRVYYYNMWGDKTSELEFLRASDFPKECRLNNTQDKTYRRRKVDDWFYNQFRLDGAVITRALQAIEDLKCQL